jgi:putative ABC transport system permease protein
MRSLRIALRSLSRTPALSLAVVLSLGLGIGANTAIFSLLHQILLRSMPVGNPSELVALNSPAEFKYENRSTTDDSGGMDAIFSYPVFRELERHPQGLRGLAGYRQADANLSFQGKTLSGTAAMVSGGYFPVLGVQPLLGRTLTGNDDRGAGQPVAMLSYGYWKDKLGAQADVLNRPIRVNGKIFTIVGVLPNGFNGISLIQKPNVYVPMIFKPALTPGWDGRDKHDDFWIYVFGRLKADTTPAQAQAALNSVYSGLVAEEARTKHGRDAGYLKRLTASRLSLVPAQTGQSGARDEMRTPLYILIACTALVLLIAAANAANLLLARAVQRASELAIRAALGASRSQIIRQLLTEALVLSLGGCGLGLLLANWTLSLLVSSVAAEGEMLSFLAPELEWPVLLFCLGVSLTTGLLFGLYPAWAGSRAAVATTLKEDSGRSSATRGGVRVRKALVCAQVTISILLLIPMGLFLKSLVNLLHVDLGLKTDSVMTFGISPQMNGYKPDRSQALFERAERELSAIPGVRNVTACMVPLIGGSNWNSSVTVEGYSRDRNADTGSSLNEVGPGFFGRMGVPLVNGREFTESDTLAGPKVAIVNEMFARHFFGAGNPIGRRFANGVGTSTLDIQIVGVVKDTKYSRVRQDSPRLFFIPYRQDDGIGGITFYVRMALPAQQIVPQIRRVMQRLDPDLPLENLRTLDQQVRLNIFQDRLVLQLASAFAVLATALAMLGLYGVMAYGVTRRRREFGIRLALGAGTGSIRSLVLREAGLILAAGMLVGVPAALGLAKLVESQLFGVKSFDAFVVAAAIAALGAAGFLAGYVPAWRASRIDPQLALRYE